MSEPVRLALHAMGCRFELVLAGDDPARLRGAGEAAFAEVHRLHRLLSKFEPHSDISRLNQHGAHNPVRIDAETGLLLARCRALSRLTDGAFDVLVGGLIAGTDTARPGSRQLHLGEGRHSAGLSGRGTAVDLGGIGKGYALDVVADVLREAGVSHAFVHAGTSSLLALGPPADQPPYRVALAEPEAVSSDQNSGLPPRSEQRGQERRGQATFSQRELRGQAMGVSGRIMSGREHLLDPRTGQPITGALLAAVVHPSATVADTLATALVVAGEQLWPHLPARFPEAEALLVTEGPDGAVRILTLGTWEVR